MTNDQRIDPEGKLAEMLESAQKQMAAAHQFLQEKRQAALAAGIIESESYAKIIDAASELHNALNTMRWAIGEHDADLESPSGKPHTDVDNLFAEMGL